MISWVLSVVNGLLGCCCGVYLLSHEWSLPSCNPPYSCIIINYLGHYFTMFPCMSTRTIECANNACQCVVSAFIGICVIDLICRVDTFNCRAKAALDSIPSPEITIVQACTRQHVRPLAAKRRKRRFLKQTPRTLQWSRDNSPQDDWEQLEGRA